MVNIASISRGAFLGLLYNIHHIARSILRLIEEDHRIAAHDEKAYTSHGPSIRPPMSSITIKMQPIRGRERGRGGGQGCGQRGGGGPGGRAAGRSIDETSIPPDTFIPPECSTPPLRLSYHPSIPHHPRDSLHV